MQRNLPHKPRVPSNQKGFTLIELLIVIAIIGILSGVLISVVNPVKQQQKANETVMRSNMDKLKMALLSCINSRVNPYNSCRSFANVGANNPTGEPKSTTSYALPWSWGTSDYLYVYAALNTSNPNGECRAYYRYRISAGRFDYTWTNGVCVIDF